MIARRRAILPTRLRGQVGRVGNAACRRARPFEAAELARCPPYGGNLYDPMIQPLLQISAPTRALSAYIAQAAARRLPAEVAEKARHHVLDTLAAMVSGSRLTPGRTAIAYVRRLGGTPQASVAGCKIMTSCINAALANGMLAHADETDDSPAPSRNHPGCAVVPAALAAAEAVPSAGERISVTAGRG